MCLVFAFFGFYLGTSCKLGNAHYDVERGLLFALPCVMVGACLLFSKEVVPVLNEQSSLQLTIVFLYFLFTNPDHIFLRKNLYIVPIVFFTTLTLYSVFSLQKTKRKILLTLYAGFFIMVATLSFHQINILTIFDDALIDWQDYENPIGIFISGISFAYLVICLCYLVVFFAWPRIFRADPKRFKSFQENMIQKYDHTQLKRVEALLIILLQGGVLTYNYFFHVIDDTLAINVSIVATQLLVMQQSRILKLLQRLTSRQ